MQRIFETLRDTPAACLPAVRRAARGGALERFSPVRTPRFIEGAAAIALTLFDDTKRIHKLGDREREWLEFAAFLHDIGGKKGFNAAARIGMLHTALIDHEEGFWPRWISQVGVERNGFFSSSDVGLPIAFWR